MEIGDINHDGALDVVLVGANGATQILINQGGVLQHASPDALRVCVLALERGGGGPPNRPAGGGRM